MIDLTYKAKMAVPAPFIYTEAPGSGVPGVAAFYSWGHVYNDSNVCLKDAVGNDILWFAWAASVHTESNLSITGKLKANLINTINEWYGLSLTSMTIVWFNGLL